MLHKTIKWREDFGVMKLHTDEWKEIIATENASGKSYVRGFDKEGHALIYMKPTKENTHDHDGNMKHLVYTMERAIACMDSMGMGTSKLCLLIDYHGYASKHTPPMKTSKETLSILQDHYPERLHRAYAINPPFVFYAFFKLVSPFIDPVTKAKIVMIRGKEVKNHENQLFREVDVNSLETSVGGRDPRPFDSPLYLQADMNVDFLAVLGPLTEEMATSGDAESVAKQAADAEETNIDGDNDYEGGEVGDEGGECWKEVAEQQQHAEHEEVEREKIAVCA